MAAQPSCGSDRFLLQHPYVNPRKGAQVMNLLWAVAVLCILFWALGLGFHVAGGLIHILLVLAVVAVLVRLITGRTSTV
jgi:hypothetical protein